MKSTTLTFSNLGMMHKNYQGHMTLVMPSLGKFLRGHVQAVPANKYI